MLRYSLQLPPDETGIVVAVAAAARGLQLADNHHYLVEDDPLPVQ